MILNGTQLLRVLNDSYEDGINCETLADAYEIQIGDSLASFVVRECAESSETGDGMHDPGEAAHAMRVAARSLNSVARALDRMASAEATDDDRY